VSVIVNRIMPNDTCLLASETVSVGPIDVRYYINISSSSKVQQTQSSGIFTNRNRWQLSLEHGPPDI